MDKTIGEIVRKSENDYTRGTTQISSHVKFSQYDTIERIDAYLNSKHISGETDSLGREKPFFNIVTAATNIWYRATDIDRRHIRIRATKQSDSLESFLATVVLRDWMRKARFGQFLNTWGRTLSRYGSAAVKFVQNKDGLHIKVVPWNMLISDTVDFTANPKIEVIELTEAQLYGRIKTHGYDEEMVKGLCEAQKARENLDKQRKDTKNDYIKVYEVHGLFSEEYLTEESGDSDNYVQQVHIVSFVSKKNGRKTEYDDFTLFKGREAKDPYMITHLIEEEGRALSIGAVENLFEAQWMQNHSMKAIKDQLDLASKILFQTSDSQFLGYNFLTDLEQGDVFVHANNQPLTPVNNKADIVGFQNYAVQWKQLGNEINGISEAMLGAQPKSGTAWRQTEALLQESYSLFEIMTENKGLHIEDMMREWILPYIKTQLNTQKEVSTILEQHELNQIDPRFIRKDAIKHANSELKNRLLNFDLDKDEVPTQGTQLELIAEGTRQAETSLAELGNERFFKPSDFNDKTWKELFENLEWDVEINITDEAFNTQEALATLNTALKMVVQPGFSQNKKAEAIVGRILEHTGTMSPVEYNALPDTPSAPPAQVEGELGVTQK